MHARTLSPSCGCMEAHQQAQAKLVCPSPTAPALAGGASSKCPCGHWQTQCPKSTHNTQRKDTAACMFAFAHLPAMVDTQALFLIGDAPTHGPLHCEMARTKQAPHKYTHTDCVRCVHTPQCANRKDTTRRAAQHRHVELCTRLQPSVESSGIATGKPYPPECHPCKPSVALPVCLQHCRYVAHHL